MTIQVVCYVIALLCLAACAFFGVENLKQVKLFPAGVFFALLGFLLPF